MLVDHDIALSLSDPQVNQLLSVLIHPDPGIAYPVMQSGTAVALLADLINETPPDSATGYRNTYTLDLRRANLCTVVPAEKKQDDNPNG